MPTQRTGLSSGAVRLLTCQFGIRNATIGNLRKSLHKAGRIGHADAIIEAEHLLIQIAVHVVGFDRHNQRRREFKMESQLGSIDPGEIANLVLMKKSRQFGRQFKPMTLVGFLHGDIIRLFGESRCTKESLLTQ